MSHNRRYSEIIQELEEGKQRLALQMKEHVFANYTVFIETFRELRKLEDVTVDFSSAIQSIDAAMNELLRPVDSAMKQRRTAKDAGTIQWWAELPDDIDMLLANSDYESCIQAILATKTMSTNPYTVKYKLDFDVYVLKVIESLGKLVQKNEDLPPDEYIEYLRRLGAVDTAEEAFFQRKSAKLQSLMKRLEAAGTPVERMTEQCQIFFGLLSETVSETKKLQLDSAKLYMWVQQEVSIMACGLGEDFYLLEDTPVVCKALALMLNSCKVLESQGLYLRWVFQRSLLPFLQQRIREIYSKFEYSILQEISGEYWKPQVFQEQFNVYRVTSSVVFLYNTLLSIVGDVAHVVSHGDFYVSSGLAPLFSRICVCLIEKYVQCDSFENKIEEKNALCIVCNFWNLSNLVLTVAEKLKLALKTQGMELPELNIAQAVASARAKELLRKFSDQKQRELLAKHLDSLKTAPKLKSLDEFSGSFTLEQVAFIRETLKSVRGATDNSK